MKAQLLQDGITCSVVWCALVDVKWPLASSRSSTCVPCQLLGCSRKQYRRMRNHAQSCGVVEVCRDCMD
eukprot:6072312-Pyramimonas_sp.AAC.1